jgi:hypothetical protein
MYERYLVIWRDFPYYLRSYYVTYLYWRMQLLAEVEQLLYIFRYGCDVVWKSFLTAISFNNKEN